MPDTKTTPIALPNIRNNVGFLFTGQGAQYPGMGQGFYEHLPSFREMLQACDRILEPRIGHSLIDVLYKTDAPRKSHPIHQTALTQPALFALETSLAQMLIRWGIQPSAVMGHSLGESAAAYIAGVFSLEDGLHMMAQRGALMQALPKNGLMVAVEADAETVSTTIKAYGDHSAVGIAAYNGPCSIVISGESEAVGSVAQALQDQGVKTVSLRVSHAFHSELMSPMVTPFENFINTLNLHTPDIPLISTVTGYLVTDEITQAVHWGQGVRHPVRFEQAIYTMYDEGIRTFVEIGPHPVLTGMGCKCLLEDAGVLWLPLLHMRQDGWATLLQTLGQLHSRGVEVNWQAFDADFRQMRYKV